MWLVDAPAGPSPISSDVPWTALFHSHGIDEAPDPDDHLTVRTGGAGESVHLLWELVGSEAFADAVAEQVRRELDRRGRPA